MNKIYLYCSQTLSDVSFLLFDSDSVLVDTLTGTLNINDVWEADISLLPANTYTVVGKTDNRILGQEKIIWDGINIIEESGGLTNLQNTMLLELYRLMGLDPSRPLYVDKTARRVIPEIEQSIDDNAQRTIVTRI